MARIYQGKETRKGVEWTKTLPMFNISNKVVVEVMRTGNCSRDFLTRIFPFSNGKEMGEILETVLIIKLWCIYGM